MKSRGWAESSVPCHPGRPNIGLYEHYQNKPALENVVAVEVLNGGSRKGENERSAELIAKHRLRGDRRIGQPPGEPDRACARRSFSAYIKTIDDLVRELKTGNYEPVDFRPRAQSRAACGRDRDQKRTQANGS